MLILAALLAGVAALLLVPSGPLARCAPPAVGSAGPPASGAEPGAVGLQRPLGLRDAPAGPSPGLTRSVAGLAGVAVWLLLGGVQGVVAGAVVAPLLAAGLSRLESARARRDRLNLIRSAPLVADLLAASLAAGSPLERALPVVARAVGGVAGSALSGVHRRIELGEPPAMAWLALTGRPGLDGIARAVARSARTGAPLSGLLSTTADDLRSAASAAALAEVRAASVRAVLPLGLCLLPAFALLGIVPIVGGLIPMP
ncbi:MAG: type II secretion system F family protein [Candidatus Nanopelagicales bacterium]